MELKKVKDIIPYENNPRHNEKAVDYVANSIKEFGFKNPIIVDKNNFIVAGHTRLKAAIKLGLKEVPVIIADDLTDEQIRAFRLADNKVSELSTWDFEMLDFELDEISDIDMSQFDFMKTEIDWSSVDEISEENYEKPESDKLRCPICGGIDEKLRFVKVAGDKGDKKE